MVFFDLVGEFNARVYKMELLEFAGGASWPQYAAAVVIVVLLIYWIYSGALYE